MHGVHGQYFASSGLTQPEGHSGELSVKQLLIWCAVVGLVQSAARALEGLPAGRGLN
jgi:hypothetical protein